jgi:hypothetical protein
MMTEKLISMQSIGNDKYSILYVMIVCPWLGNRNVKVGNMTTVQMAVSPRRWVLLSISYCVICFVSIRSHTSILVLELPVIFYLEQESNIEDFIVFEVFGNVSHY